MARSQRHMREIRGLDSQGSAAASVKNDPKVLTVPTKSGTAQVGQTLTGVNGTFDGPKIKITRQWIRGASTVISGATGATYQPQVADIGQTIKFRNVATSPYGTVTSDSTPTAAVIAA